MTEKYAVFFENLWDNDWSEIKLCLEAAPDRESADFKAPPWKAMGFKDTNVERYESLDAAITEARDLLHSSHINGGDIVVAGVVPIDRGEYTYMMYGQTVKIGAPVYTARAKTVIRRVTDYDVGCWSNTLNKTNEQNKTTPPPEEWNKIPKEALE